ncbi:MAG: hypothetical protein FWD88_07840 [Treponema sp.]|nr:hypothetical protein [Treponema sp.]
MTRVLRLAMPAIALAFAFAVIGCDLFDDPFNGEWVGLGLENEGSVFSLKNGRWEERFEGEITSKGTYRYEEWAKFFIMDPTHFIGENGRMMSRRAARRAIARELPFSSWFTLDRSEFLDTVVGEIFVSRGGDFAIDPDYGMVIVFTDVTLARRR